MTASPQRAKILAMARKRFQARGHLYQSSSGNWRHQHWVDSIDESGRKKPKRKDILIGPASGAGKMTEKQAWSFVQQHVLPRVNADRHNAQSGLTLDQFVESYFRREYMRRLRPSTQLHYETRLKCHISPMLGAKALRDIEYDDVLDCVFAVLDDGKSTQTATHVRNILSAIFKHAKRKGHYHKENPARQVEAPAIERRESFAYSWEQARSVLRAMPEPWVLPVRIAILTGLRVGEIRGLKWKRVNLSDEWVVQAGENQPPLSLAVRQSFGIGGYGPVKNKGARRLVTLDTGLAGMIAEHKERSTLDNPEHPVFASGNATPFDSHNVSNRVFRPLADALGYPVAWHVFRHTHATLMDAIDMPMASRMAALGHSSPKMTMHYTHGEIDDQRKAAERMARMLGTDMVQ